MNIMALSLSLSQNTTLIGNAIQSLTMSGLTDGAAVMGDHAGISVGFPSGVTAWTSQSWGTSYGDSTYGTGSSPTDFTSGTDGTLFWEGVGDDSNTYRATASIRFALGTLSSIADGQTWTVDDTGTTLDGSASGANLTFTYAISGEPAGVTIAANGTIQINPTAVASGTITHSATDQYGRVLQDTFTYVSALRAPATAADALGPYSWTVDDTSVDIDFTADFTANGNTLGYAISGLPAGVVDDGDGSGSGTPTAVDSGTITITATDEYGRITTSTPDFTTALRAQATAASGLGPFSFTEDVAITSQNLAADFTVNGNTVSYAMVAALPTGLSVSSAGLMSGTPTDVTASASYTLRATDEYARTTDSTFNVAIVAAGDVTAPVETNFTYNDTTGLSTADLDEACTLHVATYNSASGTPTDSGAGWSGTTLEEFTQALSPGANVFSFNDTAASATATHFARFYRDPSGNNTAVQAQVYTHDITGPSLVPASSTPADGATDIAIDANITLIFNETVVAGSGNFYIYDTSGPTLVETIAVGSATIGTTDVVLNPVADLSNSTAYSVRWDAGVVEDQRENDAAANATDTLLNFTTVAGAGGSFFEDDATGTDGQLVTARTGWGASGDNTARFEIQSNRIRLTSPGGGSQVVIDTAPTNDQRAACDMLAPSTAPTGAGWIGPQVRGTAGALVFNGYTPRVDHFADTVQAGQGDLGSEGPDVTFTTILSNYGINVATGCAMATQATGGAGVVSVRLFIGATGTTPTTEITEAAYTDAGPYADLSGVPGIASLNGDITVDFDNFEVTEV